MASPTLISVVTVSVGTSATPGAQAVTVPSDATGVVLFAGQYSGAGASMSGLTSTFGTFSGGNKTEFPSTPVINGVLSWWANVTATGSQTFTPVWTNALLQGPAICLAFFKDLDSTWVRDTGSVQSDYSTASDTLTTAVGDIVIRYETQDGGTAPGTASGWTSQSTPSQNSIGARVSTIVAAGTTQGATTVTSNFPGLAVLAIAGASGGGGVTGTLAVTEAGSDTLSSTGKVIVDGDLVVTEAGGDTAAISGKVVVDGDISASETGSDTAVIIGGSVATGTLDATEAGNDTAALAGSVLVEGLLSVSEVGSDTAAFAGTVLVEGDLAAAEAGSDTAALLGVVLVQGSIAVTESDADTFAATGSLSGGINGSLNATESGSDAFASSGLVVVSGVLLAGEAGTDSAVVSGAVLVQGALTVSEAGSDVFAAEGSASIRTGTLDAVESGSDSAEILGPRGSNLTQAAPGLIPKIWPGLSIRYEGKPKQRVEQLDEEERERIEEIAEQAVIDAAAERTKKAMKASLQASMRAAEIELAAKSYLHLVEQAALLRAEQIEEEDIAVALLLM